MTPAPWQGDRPPDNIRHTWKCTRRGPTVETIRADPSGHPHVVLMCNECDQTDLAQRPRDQTERRPT